MTEGEGGSEKAQICMSSFLNGPVKLKKAPMHKLLYNFLQLKMHKCLINLLFRLRAKYRWDLSNSRPLIESKYSLGRLLKKKCIEVMVCVLC